MYEGNAMTRTALYLLSLLSDVCVMGYHAELPIRDHKLMANLPRFMGNSNLPRVSELEMRGVSIAPQLPS
jgi:hypothetical protein